MYQLSRRLCSHEVRVLGLGVNGHRPVVKKILTVVGARPQFIKSFAVSRVLGAMEDLTELVVHTGQHYDDRMSDVFFAELELPTPHYNLAIGSGTHGAQTGRMLLALEEVMVQERPDVVLIYGDTNSTLAGALAAAKLNVPVAHVEAGLRSFNRRMPEEINRVLSDHVSQFLFAPTAAAVENLRKEGIDGDRVHLVGDVMLDVARSFQHHAPQAPDAPAPYVLVTVHRAENTDDPDRLRTIIRELDMLARDMPVIWPMHPRTRLALDEIGVDLGDALFDVRQPVGYLEMLALERQAALVVTDSGGVQKEAFFLGVPCVTLRDETEWIELIELGWNTLAPPSPDVAIRDICLEQLARRRGEPPTEIYGDGNAAEKIVDAISTWLLRAPVRTS